MKIRPLIILAIALVVLWPAHGFAKQYPSGLLGSPREFLVVSNPDLRLFVCSGSYLDDRIQRKVCVIDFVSELAMANKPEVLEVPVGSGTNMIRMMQWLKLKSYRQIRIFKQNEVVQSDMLTGNIITNDFRGLTIEPGDLIVFTLQGY